MSHDTDALSLTLPKAGARRRVRIRRPRKPTPSEVSCVLWGALAVLAFVTGQPIRGVRDLLVCVWLFKRRVVCLPLASPATAAEEGLVLGLLMLSIIAWPG